MFFHSAASLCFLNSLLLGTATPSSCCPRDHGQAGDVHENRLKKDSSLMKEEKPLQEDKLIKERGHKVSIVPFTDIAKTLG